LDDIKRLGNHFIVWNPPHCHEDRLSSCKFVQASLVPFMSLEALFCPDKVVEVALCARLPEKTRGCLRRGGCSRQDESSQGRFDNWIVSYTYMYTLCGATVCCFSSVYPQHQPAVYQYTANLASLLKQNVPCNRRPTCY
jgi:hypothetical protein